MKESPSQPIGGLECLVSGRGSPRETPVLVLHGWAMEPEDLEPFTRSLGVPATFYLPRAPLRVEPRGRAWWPVDEERRTAALATGPRDLAAEAPPGALDAGLALSRVVTAVRERHPGGPLVVVGFSQGGMLACDAILRGTITASALALLSSSRVRANEWERSRDRLRGLPILVSHGRADTDLAFAAGERLRDFAMRAGAEVTWVPFDGGHEVPLVVWRALKRFLGGIGPPTPA